MTVDGQAAARRPIRGRDAWHGLQSRERSWPSRRPSRSRPGGTTGRSSFVRGRSRTPPMSSLRRRSAARRASRRVAARWSSIRGERSSRRRPMPSGSSGRSWTSTASERFGARSPSSPTGDRAPTSRTARRRASLPGRQVYLMSWTPIASPLLIAPVPTGPDVTYRTNQPTRQLELPLPPTMFTREVPYVGEVAAQPGRGTGVTRWSSPSCGKCPDPGSGVSRRPSWSRLGWPRRPPHAFRE